MTERVLKRNKDIIFLSVMLIILPFLSLEYGSIQILTRTLQEEAI